MIDTRSRFTAPPLPRFPDIPIIPRAHGDTSDDSDEELELFASKEFFTIQEDLFLVRHHCFQPETVLPELVTKFRREFGDSKSSDDLMMRLHLLQSDAFRALFVLYLKAVSLNRGINTMPSTAAPATVRPEVLVLLQSSRTTCETRLLQLIYDDEKLQQAEVAEMVNIEVTSRNFPKYSRPAHKRQLQRCSKVIQDLYRNVEPGLGGTTTPHQAFTLHAANTATEKLHFTDSVSFYDSVMVFNHLEQPVLDRLLLFAKDPHVMERYTLQKQQQQESTHIKRELRYQLQQIFEAQRQIHEVKLEEQRRSEYERVKEHLEQTLEEDILHLRRMHEMLLQAERAKINAKYDAQIALVTTQIQQMRTEIATLQRECDNNGWNTLDREIMQSSVQIERIFGSSDYILRLLILAEDLDAEPLRRALIRYLSRDRIFPQFALRREFTSKMISETTVLAIVKGISTSDLREIDGSGKSFVYHELTARELHTRKIAFGRFLASLTNDQLRAVSRFREAKNPSMTEDFFSAEMLAQITAVHDFPELLDREFARRREFTTVKMNSLTVDREVSFSEDDCVLQLEASHRYCAVFATKERKHGECGKWMFEVTIEVFAGEGESMLVGWEVPRSHITSPSGDSLSSMAKLPAFVPGLSPGSDGRSFGITWQSDGGLEMGMLHANGQSKSGVPCFRAGDVLACTINQDELVPLFRFYLNGVQVLPPMAPATSTFTPPASVIPGASSSAGSDGIACQNAVYCLFPVLSMYSSRKKPQMRTRFNFRGNFQYPLPGFEPYGAPL
ncbi:hypothetical protein Poli38472_009822 [Pythium oligandrum]|uniref:SPRY domain-containing protein n=1 Tax=Pythium oligandrum TaxID=41045 RepID=A0A8K1CFZ2_PYTOL|nr:hypothetical protein Poli38472_009822 [Pythium oligandrum]|eukprot:TMW62329.1 hypothetical protein Poli38472_009822 [Pythium oligandrum]